MSLPFNQINIHFLLKEILQKTIAKLNLDLSSKNAEKINIFRNKPNFKDEFSTNVVFLLNSKNNQSKNELACLIKDELLKNDLFLNVSVAKNLYINMSLSQNYFDQVIGTLCQDIKIQNWTQLTIPNNHKISFEFLCANPTGDLHAGHVRNMLVSDSLIKLMRAFNFNIDTVHYTNDRGNQANLMGLTLFIHYLNLCDPNQKVSLPENCYQDPLYLQYAQKFYQEYQNKFQNYQYDETGVLDPELKEILRAFGTACFVEHFQKMLCKTNTTVDEWYYESSIYKGTKVSKMIEYFKSKDLLYFQDGAWFLKTTLYGDDKDRVFIKSNGEYTYIVSDIIYHNERWNKYDELIDTWGADHHGYIERMKIGLATINAKKVPVNIKFIIIQLVNILLNQTKQRLSKRRNVVVTLTQMLDVIDANCLRFYMLTSSCNNPLTIDISNFKNDFQNSQYYYCQYAHVRTNSILKNAPAITPFTNQNYTFSPEEKNLILKVLEIPSVINSTIKTLEPNLYVKYIVDFSKLIHQYLNQQKIITSDPYLTNVRLHLVKIANSILKQSLQLLGIKALLTL